MAGLEWQLLAEAPIDGWVMITSFSKAHVVYFRICSEANERILEYFVIRVFCEVNACTILSSVTIPQTLPTSVAMVGYFI